MKYKSEILEVLHKDVAEMFEIGIVTSAQMREFDEMCLVREPEPAQKVTGPAETKRASPATA